MHTIGLLKLCPEGFDESAPSVVEACGRNSKAALEASPEQGTAHDVHLCPGQPSIGLYGRIELQPEVSWHSVAKLIKHPAQRWRLALIKLKAVWAAAASKPWSVAAKPATKLLRSRFKAFALSRRRAALHAAAFAGERPMLAALEPQRLLDGNGDGLWCRFNDNRMRHDVIEQGHLSYCNSTHGPPGHTKQLETSP